MQTQNWKADARPKCTNAIVFDIGRPSLTSSICAPKFQRWCNTNNVTAGVGGVFKAANALQSYLALRCVVHHPSPNSAASTSTPPLCGAVPSTTTPGSNVNLLQINIWLWTNYNAFFAFALWEQVALLQTGENWWNTLKCGHISGLSRDGLLDVECWWSRRDGRKGE